MAAAQCFFTGNRIMTVYAINQRVFEQSASSGSGSKSGTSTADQFLAALSQASGQVSAGTGATPSAEQALKKVFDRQNDETRPTETVAEKPRRSEGKTQERKENVQQGRETQPAEDTQAQSAPRDQSGVSQDSDEGRQAAAPAAPAETADDAATTQVVAQDSAAPQVEVVATVVPVEQQLAQTVTTTGEQAASQTVQVVNAENIADAGDTPQQTQAAPQNNAAAGEAGEVQTFDAAVAATQQAAKGKSAQHADKNAAAQAQADDLAVRLDDTGAQLNVQVKVSEASKPVQPTVGTAEVLLTQDVDGVDVVLPAQTGNGQSGGQAQANAGQTGQAAANPAVDPAAMNRPVDAKPFVAALAAAQAESASQPQATSSGAGNQTQAVAGLNGATGTQAAAKTAQAQTAQAARPQQMPQAKEVLDQVKVQIAKQGANGDTIKVQLKPVELGSIEVKLDVAKDGSVSGVVTADNKDTLAMLKNDSRSLEKALSDAGFKTDSGSLTFNLRGEQQQNAQDQGTGRRARRGALAAANGIDATQAGMAAQAQARFAGGRSGVDIQV